jgi:diguanylate cyclase (GGDEF)-like protein
MEAPQVTEQTRKRLVTLLAGDRPDGDRLITRLRELRELEGVPTCALVLHMLAHISLPEKESEQLLLDLLRHRQRVTGELGRDPGLRVAAIDYLSNVRKLLNNPTIVELSQLERTERSAVTDSLTDLYNRRYFDDALQLEIRRSERYALNACLLMLDLDAFKPVNDLYGHPFGDLVLKRAGRVIRRSVRESDLACRFGGEEFAVILPETDRLGAFAVAERVRRAIEKGFMERSIGGRAVAMTISGGIAAYPPDGSDAATLVTRADQALYLSKTRGRNRVSIYFSERRRAVRYPVRRSARASIARPEGEPSEVATLNLSFGGALLATDNEYRPAEQVRLTFGGRDHVWVVGGRVVRVERGSNPAGGRLIAVAFESPLPELCIRHHVRRTGLRRALQGGGG